MMWCEDLQRDVGFCSGQCKICEIKKQEEKEIAEAAQFEAREAQEQNNDGD